MSKVYGLFGAMTGKLADVVMSVRYGEQIARKYQPIVSNPSTPLQVEQRAKLKMMSQMAAVMGPVIAMVREGAVSSRNLFVKKNIRNATYSDNTASIDLANIQLTSSVVGLPNITAVRGSGAIAASLDLTGGVVLEPGSISRIVYNLFAVQDDGTIRLSASAVAQTAGDNNNWPVDLPLVSSRFLVLAYSVRDNTDAARALFGDIEVLTGATVASLIVQRTLKSTDVTLSETKGYYKSTVG